MSLGMGFKYKLKNDAYFFLKNEFEYRLPSANLRNILDYTRTESWLISVG